MGGGLIDTFIFDRGVYFPEFSHICGQKNRAFAWIYRFKNIY